MPKPNRSGPLRVRFWGTRGSLPAPLREQAVRAKIRDALLAARGHVLETEQAIDAFIDSSAAIFSARHVRRQHQLCGDHYRRRRICALRPRHGRARIRQPGAAGSTAPAASTPSTYSCRTRTGTTSWGSRFSPPLTFRQSDLHLRLPRRLARGAAHPALGSLVSRRFSLARLDHRVHHLGARPHLSDSRPFRHLDQTISHGGFLRVSLFPRREVDRLFYRLRAQDTPTSTKPYPFVEFYRNADLLIFDAMYSLGDSVSVKEDWGHSSNVVAVELAQAARVRRLVLFHHEPAYDDRMLEEVLADTVRFEAISRPGRRGRGDLGL